jgi:hypothetical protein
VKYGEEIFPVKNDVAAPVTARATVLRVPKNDDVPVAVEVKIPPKLVTPLPTVRAPVEVSPLALRGPERVDPTVAADEIAAVLASGIVIPAFAVINPEAVTAATVESPVTPSVVLAEIAVADKVVVVTLFKAVFPLDTLRPPDEFNPTAPTEPLAVKLTTLAVPAETVSDGVETLVAVSACTLVAPETVNPDATTRPPTAFTFWPTRPK